MRGRCPICGKDFEFHAITEWPTFPFCSERCRLIDLGRWIDGAYAIPSAEVPAAPGQTPGQPAGDIEEDS